MEKIIILCLKKGYNEFKKKIIINLLQIFL
jgi:hypothetical protein